jgi:predicted SnoaL-like aldol condensation-catalyzing enzyme
MKEDQADSILRRMVAAFEIGALDDVETYVASNYLDHQGLGSPLHGPAGFRQVVQTARSHARLNLLIEDLVTDGERAAARIRWQHQPYDGGDTVERETIDIIRVENGKAAEHWGAKAWDRTVQSAKPAV